MGPWNAIGAILGTAVPGSLRMEQERAPQSQRMLKNLALTYSSPHRLVPVGIGWAVRPDPEIWSPPVVQTSRRRIAVVKLIRTDFIYTFLW
ncbi:unnamed protein product [Macrosiphum euphorbiae]|uniref:Secreted protein n=1 Tax=Macrosiphum euphorbiae TaxID=13131 RepID=A0AAV0WGT2_9HEMI|nr:unnamed protein product [Macrosiphum euphorbiae]